jgi:hypothetical protein
VLRSPFMLAFADFDSRLRAIQIFNIVLVACTITLYSYILSWAVPRKWHWLAIGFAFGFTLLSPEWVANVFEMLADAPYAFFTILCVIIIATVVTSSRSVTTHWLVIVGALACFVIAFLMRFTAPVLVAYAAVLAAGRISEREVSGRSALRAVIGAAVAIAILVALNWETISSRYLADMAGYATRGSKPGMMINLFAIALPSQIIPDLSLALTQFPTQGKFNVTLGSTPRDLTILAIGICISLVMLWGMWRSRTRFAPEIVYTLAVLPVLTLMIQSTSRYLMAYQPFLWIFFFAGIAPVLEPVSLRVMRWRRAAFIGLALLAFAGTGLVLVRMKKMQRTGGGAASLAFGQTRSYAPEIVSTFDSLRGFLEKLPRQRTLLIGGRGTFGRWKVISGLDYYFPDSSLSSVAATKDVYLLLECGTDEDCSVFDKWDSRAQQYLNKFGQFRLDLVFSRGNEHAMAKVYRLNPARE